MPRLTKIYTRKGDDGSTGLGGGQRVAKDSPRVAAYGTVDELSSAIGVALAHGVVPRLAAALPPIQNELFHLGSDLCFLEEDKGKWPIPQIESRHVDALEALIDELNDVVGPLANFILPGGAPGSAHLHVARTVCRRAERDVLTLSRLEPIGKHAIAYLNRLSDALFVMARYENNQRGVAEPLWDEKA
jgi:cob(I)alamin adenosyltransferase